MGLNVRRAGDLGPGFSDQVLGGLELVRRDHDAGLGEIDGVGVSGVAENLCAEAVRFQDSRQEVRLQAVAAKNHLPALDAHGGAKPTPVSRVRQWHWTPCSSALRAKRR